MLLMVSFKEDIPNTVPARLWIEQPSNKTYFFVFLQDCFVNIAKDQTPRAQWHGFVLGKHHIQLWEMTTCGELPVGRHSSILPLSFSGDSVGLQSLYRFVNTDIKVSSALPDLRDFKGW